MVFSSTWIGFQHLRSYLNLKRCLSWISRRIGSSLLVDWSFVIKWRSFGLSWWCFWWLRLKDWLSALFDLMASGYWCSGIKSPAVWLHLLLKLSWRFPLLQRPVFGVSGGLSVSCFRRWLSSRGVGGSRSNTRLSFTPCSTHISCFRLEWLFWCLGLLGLFVYCCFRLVWSLWLFCCSFVGFEPCRLLIVSTYKKRWWYIVKIYKLIMLGLKYFINYRFINLKYL